MLQIIMLSCFVTSLLFLIPLIRFFISKQRSILRLKRYTSSEEIREEKKRETHREYRAGLAIIARRIGSARFLDGYKKRVQLQLSRAHILLKAEEFITICIFTFAITGLAGLAATHSPLVFFPMGAVGWLVPGMYVKSRIKKRIKLLNDQLCDAIILITSSLKAGYSFFQAVDVVSKEMTGPIAEEFTLLQREVNLGLTTEKALENLVDRVFSDDLGLVVTAVLIQRQVGGNLAEVLDNISSTIRERIKIKGEVRTVTAQGRMSGLIIAVLPVLLGVILYLINPEHIGLLFKEPLGIGILVFSVLMELVGIYFINKIVKIEV
jgi:tight adherence protein B